MKYDTAAVALRADEACEARFGTNRQLRERLRDLPDGHRADLDRDLAQLPGLRERRLVLQAQVERRETGRSLYRRSDYPELDESLNRVLSVRREDGRPMLTWK